MKQEPRHIPALDGLRGVAILMVLVFHYGNILPQPAHRIREVGAWGVDLFFVVSGFLITRIRLANLGADRYLAAFYWRRALRIFPLYYAYLSFVFLIWPAIFWFRGLSNPSPDGFLWFASYLSNWMPGLGTRNAG